MATPSKSRPAWPCSAWIFFVVNLAGGLTFAMSVSAAVVFTVNSTSDQIDDNPTDGVCHTAAGTCTLRAAFMSANRASGVGATIVVPTGTYTLVIPATVADDDDNGDLNLSVPAGYAPGPTTITGAGAAVTIIDANGIDRVLSVAAGRTGTISGVTVRNGTASRLGGGIYNAGTLTADRIVVSSNSAGERGGGICNVAGATLTLSRSTVDGNTMSSSNLAGGGLYSEGTLQVNQSTVSNNTASEGGGIYILFGTLLVTNSTIILNNAVTNGGGIYNEKMSNIYNTTIFFNQAAVDDASGGTGGGVYNNSNGLFNLRNSVIAGNYLSGFPIYNDCTGNLGIYGNNRFSNTDDCTAAVGSTGSAAYLGSLNELGSPKNNGGPTQTIAIIAPSDMIDGGDAVQGCIDQNAVPLKIDQRGFPRSAGAHCDIGAFEYGIIFANGFD
jgi:predicted outer membrane repeat protein